MHNTVNAVAIAAATATASAVDCLLDAFPSTATAVAVVISVVVVFGVVVFDFIRHLDVKRKRSPNLWSIVFSHRFRTYFSFACSQSNTKLRRCHQGGRRTHYRVSNSNNAVHTQLLFCSACQTVVYVRFMCVFKRKRATHFGKNSVLGYFEYLI